MLNFATTNYKMLNIEEAYHIMGGPDIGKMWEGWIACGPTDKKATFSTNLLGGTVSSFSFTLVKQGHVSLSVGERELTIRQGELFIHFPGYPIYIKEVSDDYQAICLGIDEQAAYQSAAFRKMIHESPLLMTHFEEPSIKLSQEEATRLEKLMMMVNDYIHRPNMSTNDILNMLLSIFLLNLHNNMEWSTNLKRITKRDEDIFVTFYALLRQNFTEQHHISFYADRLNMTTTHLSRIVKAVTGRTVISFIDQMLMMEATWLLLSTSLTISQIADKLNFATASSFDKFFTRMKGFSPKQVREKMNHRYG